MWGSLLGVTVQAWDEMGLCKKNIKYRTRSEELWMPQCHKQHPFNWAADKFRNKKDLRFSRRGLRRWLSSSDLCRRDDEGNKNLWNAGKLLTDNIHLRNSKSMHRIINSSLLSTYSVKRARQNLRTLHNHKTGKFHRLAIFMEQNPPSEAHSC